MRTRGSHGRNHLPTDPLCFRLIPYGETTLRLTDGGSCGSWEIFSYRENEGNRSCTIGTIVEFSDFEREGP
jgi:hypothetical protein